MDTSLRSLAPKDHDRVCELLKRYPCDFPKLATHLQIIKIFKIPSKYMELLDKIEVYSIRNAGFNFILQNAPEFAELRETGALSKVGRESMRDTLNQFGIVEKLDIVHGTVYAKFEDPEPCHKLINNMQLGQNIITTKIW